MVAAVLKDERFFFGILLIKVLFFNLSWNSGKTHFRRITDITMKYLKISAQMIPADFWVYRRCEKSVFLYLRSLGSDLNRSKTENISVISLGGVFFSVKLIWEPLFLLTKVDNTGDCLGCLGTPCILLSLPLLGILESNPMNVCRPDDMDKTLTQLLDLSQVGNWQKQGEKLPVTERPSIFLIREGQKTQTKNSLKTALTLHH